MIWAGCDPAYAKAILVAWCTSDAEWKTEKLNPTRPLLWQRVWQKMIDDGVRGVAIEGGYVGPNSHVALGLAEMRGMLRLSAMTNGLMTAQPRVATWRKILPGKGNAKTRAIELARETCGRKLSADAAEAMCIALWAQQTLGGE